jgi:hypothetical protein
MIQDHIVITGAVSSSERASIWLGNDLFVVVVVVVSFQQRSKHTKTQPWTIPDIIPYHTVQYTTHPEYLVTPTPSRLFLSHTRSHSLTHQRSTHFGSRERGKERSWRHPHIVPPSQIHSSFAPPLLSMVSPYLLHLITFCAVLPVPSCTADLPTWT